jgi:hypothetical protein
MSLLKLTNSGVQKKPLIHTIYGINGVGKTTLASQFPAPYFADLEDGSGFVSTNRLGSDVLSSFAKYRALITELATTSHPHKTFVTDSIESLEALIGGYVCEESAVSSIELAMGGFGKGFTRSRELMRDTFLELRKLANTKNMTIVLLGHAQVKPHTDPVENVTYDRVIMRCNDKFAAVIKDLSDTVLYAKYKDHYITENGKTKAVTGKERVLRTRHSTAYDAKNRIGLPEEIGLSYRELEYAINNPVPITADDIRPEVLAMVAEIPDEATRAKATQQTKEAKTLEQLVAIKARVNEITKTKGA